MTKMFNAIAAAGIVLLMPIAATAQTTRTSPSPTQTLAQSQATPNVPPAARQAEADVERAAKRFRFGVEGGISLDPELLDVGAHVTFGPIFTPAVEFRPGLELGVGEVTTAFGINLDVLYLFPGATTQTRWRPYIGAGPNFALSHRSLDVDVIDDDDDDDEGDIDGDGTDDRSRFDFSDTDFTGGFNFIAGARSPGGMFLELKATAYGVSNIRVLVGYTF